MAVQVLTIHGWIPARLNQLIGNRRKAGALKRRDRHKVGNAAIQQGIVKAPPRGRRRVTIEITYGKGDRSADPDAYYKSTHDALVHAKLLARDTHKGVQITEPIYLRGERRMTRIFLEDI